MNIINYIEDEHGKDKAISFIRGLWDWQEKKIFKESLSNDGEFFIKTLTNSKDTFKDYIISSTLYKGLECSFDEIVDLDYTSYTLDKAIAVDFADSEGNGGGVVIRKYGGGYSVQKITRDAIEWMLANKDKTIQELHIDDPESINDDYVVEDEIISSLKLAEFEVVKL